MKTMLSSIRKLFLRGHARTSWRAHAHGNTQARPTVERAAAEPGACAAAIYGPQLLPVTEQARSAMRAEVARAVAQGVVCAPTDAQWDMILSDHPATCVVAGAGSGKSTTLVLRVVFMLCHLRVNPMDLTVISFTVESCRELREKLLKVLSCEAWKSHLEPCDAQNLKSLCERMVSTFHAALGRVAKRAYGDNVWFDFLGISNRSGECQTDNVDSTMFGGRLTDQQRALLNTAYRTLYHDDAEFRGHVLAMLRIECDRHTLLDDRAGEAKAIALASRRDLELTRMISARWGNAWIMPGIDPEPFVAFRVDGHPFYANGRITKTGMPIFLSLNGHLDEQALFDEAEVIGTGKPAFPIFKALKVKRDIVQACCDREALHLVSQQRIEWLATRLRYLTDDDFKSLDAPAFPVRLKGELAAVNLVEAFFAQASFIESLGMDVRLCTQNMLGELQPRSLDAHFAAALGRFWPAFESALARQARPIRSFNRAFLDLGESATHPAVLPGDALRPFTHLLVDEFQDISPQVVSWLRAMQRRVKAQGLTPTLMAIGDDWQSIYGWRGSAAEMFIDFARHFPVHAQLGKPRECRMMDNYRSVAPIIADAQRIVDDVQVKIEKSAKAVKSTQAGDHGIRLVKGIDPRSNAGQIAEEIRRQLAYVDSLPSADKNKVLVMSRSNAVLTAVSKAFGSAPGVRFLTFHGAKGLQGEVAILCDDCVYEGNHTLRNAAYRASGLFRQSYDAAARDEARRLAYVAVTRGIRRVVWFVGEPKGAAAIFTQPR